MGDTRNWGGVAVVGFLWLAGAPEVDHSAHLEAEQVREVRAGTAAVNAHHLRVEGDLVPEPQ